KPIKKLALLSSPYTPSPNVFSNQEVYKKESIRLVVDGEFKIAQLRVKGSVQGGGKHFLFLDFGNKNGVLNGVRGSASGIDILATEERGGVFTKEAPIDVLIDLLGETTLATTRAEFQTTRQTTKIVKLWEALQPSPPTMTRVLVIPFEKSGNFTGATIISLDFEFSCKVEGSCGVGICPINEITSKCLERNFGWSKMDSWLIRSGHKK
ncbi:MAG: hypothetical protein WAP52_03585, partial [Candidatus Sungiibacteriota bacterium]